MSADTAKPSSAREAQGLPPAHTIEATRVHDAILRTVERPLVDLGPCKLLTKSKLCILGLLHRLLKGLVELIHL